MTTCPVPLPGETQPGFPGKEVLLEAKAWVRALSSSSAFFWGAVCMVPYNISKRQPPSGSTQDSTMALIT